METIKKDNGCVNRSVQYHRRLMHNKKHRQLEYATGRYAVCQALSMNCWHIEIFGSQACITFLFFFIECDIYKYNNNKNNQDLETESATTFCFAYNRISPKWIFKLFITFSEYVTKYYPPSKRCCLLQA